MALVLEVAPCANCVGSSAASWCEPCRKNGETLAEARQTIGRLKAALDAWMAFGQALWPLARMSIDE